MSIDHKRWGFLFLLSLVWGSSFILIKKGLLGLSPLQLGSYRIIISSIFIFCIGYKKLRGISKTQWKWLSVSGFLGTFFPSFLFAFAETEVDSTVASILNSLVPLNTILLGLIIFKIKSSGVEIFGVLLGFVGASLLILEGAELNPDQNYWYAGFIVLATLMYAANVNIIKKYLYGVPPVAIATANFIVIFIPALGVLLFSNGFSASTSQSEAFLPSLGCVVILSVFGTALAKIVFNKLILISTPVFASSVTYLMPIVALFWGVLDGEVFDVFQGCAALLILCGIYLANKN
jgi:drug/metabolite transporter (DMT)-like permease